MPEPCATKTTAALLCIHGIARLRCAQTPPASEMPRLLPLSCSVVVLQLNAVEIAFDPQQPKREMRLL